MSRFFHYDSELKRVVEGRAPVSKKLPVWPMSPCYASGVNPQQAGELREFFVKHGENVDVTSQGDPIYTSPGQRKRLLKLRGLVDKSSF